MIWPYLREATSAPLPARECARARRRHQHQTQRAQLSSYRLYVNIFDNPRIAYSSSRMKGYILGEKEFNAAFKILQERKNNSTVVLNEDKTNKLSGTKRPAKGGQTKFKSSKSPGSARRDTTQKWRKFQPKSE